MNENLCKVVRNAYISFLGDQFECRVQSSSGLIVHTPFVTPDNDPIDIAVEELPDGTYRLSDRRSAFEYLFLFGMEITESERRQMLVNEIATSYEVDVEARELAVKVSSSDLGAGLHRLLCAEQRILDIVITAVPGPLEKSFKIEVGEYLAQQSVTVYSSPIFQGHLLRHKVDYMIPNGVPKLLDTHSAKSRSAAEDEAMLSVYKWSDLKRTGSPYFTVCVLDDSHPVWESATTVLREGQTDRIYQWSDRDKLVKELVGAVPR
jgi:hypothetical protein